MAIKYCDEHGDLPPDTLVCSDCRGPVTDTPNAKMRQDYQRRRDLWKTVPASADYMVLKSTMVTKYCDIHGPVAAEESQTACVQCSTVLTAEPNARWKGRIAQALTGESDKTGQPNARALNRRQGAFLAAYEKSGRVCKAAEDADIARSTHYEWLKTDPDYAAAFAESEVIVGQSVLDEAMRRAMEGWEEPTTVAGERVMVRKFSDRLLERLLEAHHPEKFRANLAHRLVDKKGDDRQLFDVGELDKLIRAADARDGMAESAESVGRQEIRRELTK